MRIRHALWLHFLIFLLALAGTSAALLSPGSAQPPPKPHKVNITEDKPEVVERYLPIDPMIRIAYNNDQNMGFRITAEGKTYSLSVITSFMIDGNIQEPNGSSQLQPLPPDPIKKKRHGGQIDWRRGDIKVTMSHEVVPGKTPQPKPGQPIARRMDTMLIKYSIENLGTVPHKVGCRTRWDVYIVDNDLALFAAPVTHPKQILNGVALEGKQLPPYFEALQRPDLENPGEKGIYTLKFGNKLEGPSKVILTNLGASGGGWDPPPQPAGDSACVLLWQPREIQPRGKRDCAYAYGQGIASSNEARVSAQFSGPFAPAKGFTVTAYVDDPVEGQTLTLLLPKGIERIDGKETQVVPLPMENSSTSVVMWHCRLLDIGTHPIRIRSSTGVTGTWMVAVSPPD